MADRTSMRPRKGDVFIDLRGSEGRIQILIDREKVAHEQMAVIRRRVDYLQHLSIRIGDDDWTPQTFNEWAEGRENG